MNNQLLVQWEQAALNERDKGNLKEAIQLFKNILNKNPSYEHGMCFYHLACCLEDIGEFKKAEENYLEAIKYDPNDLIRLGGYASFLYLHGNPEKAFNSYLLLLKLERKNNKKPNDLLLALKELGKKIGLTENEVMIKINEVLKQA